MPLVSYMFYGVLSGVRKHICEKMVKNKNISGLCNRSSTSKTKKASSKIASTENLTPLDDPTKSDIPAALQELQTTKQVQLGFPDKVYLLASVIFQNNHLEKPAAQRLVNYGNERGIPIPKVKDEKMQRTAYELAFNALKCKFVDSLNLVLHYYFLFLNCLFCASCMYVLFTPCQLSSLE